MSQAEPEQAPEKKPRANTLSLTIRDKYVLYASYMGFVKGGGLFIPTTKEYSLGDEVNMILNLMDEAEKIAVVGKVVWITPNGSQGNKACGIGVQFGSEHTAVRNKIETYLAGLLQSDRATHTM